MAADWASSPAWLNQSLLNGSDLLSNCSNDYCIPDADYVALMETYVFPTPYEWLLIGLHTVVFFLGLIGNALVCAAVYRNPGMRTVTNYFLVNLAVADFLVILLCLPPTVIWDVTETWFMGMALCKIVLYFQTVSVAVSVLTLTFISVERWYAICFPLQFRATISRAKRAIALIWIVSLLFDLPELVVLQTQRKELRVDSVLLTQCSPSWGRQSDMIFHCVKSVVLYTLPLTLMSVAYCQIARVLWRNKDHLPVPLEAASANGIQRYGPLRLSRGRGRGQGQRRGWGRDGLPLAGVCGTQGQVRSRRKAAKMLVAVVVLFAVCYFPVHLLNILRYTVDIPQTEATVALSLVSHWLCYANSALNPLIYNFMSEKFRKEFRRTFGCRWLLSGRERTRSRSRTRSRGRSRSLRRSSAAAHTQGLACFPPPPPLDAAPGRASRASRAALGTHATNATHVEMVALTTLNGTRSYCEGERL